jgi:uncharacterized integral membrane protein
MTQTSNVWDRVPSRPSGPKALEEETMVIFRVVLMLIAFVLVLILALMNARNTTVAVVFARTYYDVPVAFVMLYAFAFGALCVGIFALVSELGLRARLRRQRKEIEGLTDELRALRNAPLDETRELSQPKGGDR